MKSVQYYEIQREIMLYGFVSAIGKTEEVFEFMIDDIIACLSKHRYYEHALELSVKVFDKIQFFINFFIFNLIFLIINIANKYSSIITTKIRYIKTNTI